MVECAPEWGGDYLICFGEIPQIQLEGALPLKAVLAIEDGQVSEGRSVGPPGKSTGECVFNVNGYQEIPDDPAALDCINPVVRESSRMWFRLDEPGIEYAVINAGKNPVWPAC